MVLQSDEPAVGVPAHRGLLDYLNEWEAKYVHVARPAERWNKRITYDGYIQVKSVPSGNVWRIKLGATVTGNVQLYKPKDAYKLPKAAGGRELYAGQAPCLWVATYSDGVWSREATELNHIAQFLAVKYDEERFIRSGFA